jgi:hypothetical protein
MFDERAFIAKIEAAGTEELADYLRHPTIEQEKALRAHLGDQRYQRMHSMALKKHTVTRGSDNSKEKGNVVVIHGIMGGELTATDRGGSGEQVWVKAFRIMTGWLERLRLADDGYSEYGSDYDVRATGIMKRYYGELLLSLSEKWNVRAFWFDWRKDLKVAATELEAQINGWFGDDKPVHLVAHSMGGLVARTFIQKFPERWEKMQGDPKEADPQKRLELGGRLIMLGTPNHGSFVVPQVITGIEGIVVKLSRLDMRHNMPQLLEIFNTFAGTYQMLPSPLVKGMGDMDRLYNSGTYGGFNVPQRHLTNAKKHHELLNDVVNPERMIYIAGFDQPTFSGINNWEKLNDVDSYDVTQDGDGRVPHNLGLLSRNGEQVKTYYIKEEHGALSSNPTILAALDGLLRTGQTNDLPDKLPTTRAVAASKTEIKEKLKRDLNADIEQLEISRSRMGSRGIRRSQDAKVNDEACPEDALKGTLISPEERKVEETLTRGFLGRRDEERATTGEIELEARREPNLKIEIGLEFGRIEEIHQKGIRSKDGDPIDAIAVGHYVNVQPQAAELALDWSISAPLTDGKLNRKSSEDKQKLILTQYTNRGIIHGKLGQPFFLPDPRHAVEEVEGEAERLIVIAGMGEAGRFGGPELAVLVREICWSLGRLEKRHLATVLIGAGNGNMIRRDAVVGWLDGIKRAVTGSAEDERRHLQRITFVEFDPRNVLPLEREILAQIEEQNNGKGQSKEDEENEDTESGGLKFIFEPFDAEKLEELRKAALKKDQEVRNAQIEARRIEREKGRDRGSDEDKESDEPTRVTLGLDAARKVYRFGAITKNASVPEREVPLDPALVWQANDELAGEQVPGMQYERGRFLEGLLIPPDLRGALYNNAPLVMMLDSTTARIHWEMVAQPEVGAVSEKVATKDRQFNANDFLGTSRGFTRQLRTTYAPPPEPPPPPRRVLRVLVVADPAEDAHLPGAQEEGVAVADLFESYNLVYRDQLDTTSVEVVRLFGPLEATRTNVLRELMVRSYDVLHFAGHCVYQWDGDPTLSGWIFNAAKKELLSARELTRIDRIPKFVFSNACESGITPDRSQERNVDLAPSFAEAFFARGVSNFVCTAWPVNDVAAREFGLTLYSRLLGIQISQVGDTYQRRDAKPMHVAMREAREAIADSPDGVATWGAYQHYGNPYFQLFNAFKDEQPPSNGNAKAARAAAKAKVRQGSKKTRSSAASGSKTGSKRTRGKRA